MIEGHPFMGKTDAFKNTNDDRSTYTITSLIIIVFGRNYYFSKINYELRGKTVSTLVLRPLI